MVEKYYSYSVDDGDSFWALCDDRKTAVADAINELRDNLVPEDLETNNKFVIQTARAAKYKPVVDYDAAKQLLTWIADDACAVCRNEDFLDYLEHDQIQNLAKMLSVTLQRWLKKNDLEPNCWGINDRTIRKHTVKSNDILHL